MSEITVALEHPDLGCGEIIARYDLTEIQEKAYQQGKLDGAREFLAWYSDGETMPSFGRYAKCKIDDVIAEWQKGAENE